MSEKVASFQRFADAAQQRRATLIEEAYTDRGHGRRIAVMHSSELAWVPEWRSWVHFDGQRWRKPADEAALQIAQSVSDVMLDLRGEVSDREAFSRAALSLQGVKPAARALEAARPMLLVRAEEFDAKPHLLNCPNGTVDLSTLTLRNHDPVDRLTILTAASYEPDAHLDLWDQVVDYALPEESVREYVKRLFGITLTGSEQLDIALLLYGITRTGKGTIQGSLPSALGEYAYTCGLEDLALRDHARTGPRPELVKLQGRRMVSVYETSRSLKLDAALLKTIAGSDPITARDMYARPVTFLPQFTIWIASNHRPNLPADDDAVWERLREVPFTVQIPEEQRDPSVRATLNDPEQAGAAVLAWAVEGLCHYHESGLETPDAVTHATAAYRCEMDVLAEFAEDHLVFGDATIYRATPQQIRGALEQWRAHAGVEPVSAGDLREWLRSRGCALVTSCGGERKRAWVGVGIRHAEDNKQ